MQRTILPLAIATILATTSLLDAHAQPLQTRETFKSDTADLKSNKRSPLVAAATSAGIYLGGWTLLLSISEDSDPNQLVLGAVAIFSAPTLGHAYAGEGGKG